jgi:hypothetical protein
MSEGPVYKGCELRLVARGCLRKHLLQLAAGRRRCDAHRARSRLQPVPLRDCDGSLSFTICEVKRRPKRFDGEIVTPIGIADEYDSTPSFGALGGEIG